MLPLPPSIKQYNYDAENAILGFPSYGGGTLLIYSHLGCDIQYLKISVKKKLKSLKKKILRSAEQLLLLQKYIKWKMGRSWLTLKIQTSKKYLSYVQTKKHDTKQDEKNTTKTTTKTPSRLLPTPSAQSKVSRKPIFEEHSDAQNDSGGNPGRDKKSQRYTQNTSHEAGKKQKRTKKVTKKTVQEEKQNTMTRKKSDDQKTKSETYFLRANRKAAERDPLSSLHACKPPPTTPPSPSG